MIPAKTDGKWKKLVTGELNHNFNNLAAGLLMSHLHREMLAKPEPQTLQKCLDEQYAFFEKYERILSRDIATIFGQES